MTREIKFRAWDKRHGRWLAPTGHSIAFPFPYAWPTEYWKPGRALFGIRNDPDLDWQQYTGLEDKNGVEIYEGDVVRLTDGDYREKVAVVQYDDYDARFVLEAATR